MHRSLKYIILRGNFLNLQVYYIFSFQREV